MITSYMFVFEAEREKREINSVLRSKEFNLERELDFCYTVKCSKHKDKQMGKPLIVHQVPVLLSVYMFRVCVFYMYVLVQHVISLCGRLTSSNSCCQGQAVATGSEVMNTVVWGISLPAVCVCVC